MFTIKGLKTVNTGNTPKLISKFNTIPIRIAVDFFIEIDKLMLIFIQNCKNNIEREEKRKKIHTCLFHNKAMIQSNDNQDSVVLGKGHMDQLNRTESPEIKPYI